VGGVGLLPGEDLAVLEELLAKWFVGELLQGLALLNGEGGGGGGRLAQNHEHRFHADGAVGDVGGGEADGHEEVFAFALAGDDGAVGDGVGFHGGDLDIAFVFGAAVFGKALAVVGIHVVGGEAHGVVDGGGAAAVVFGHDDVRDHATGFAHVELVGPAGGVDELVGGRSPLLHFGADIFGDARAGGEEGEESEGVALVLLADRFAFGGAGVWVGIIHPDEVGGEAAIVIDVGFEVGHPDGVPELAERWLFTGGDE